MKAFAGKVGADADYYSDWLSIFNMDGFYYSIYSQELKQVNDAPDTTAIAGFFNVERPDYELNSKILQTIDEYHAQINQALSYVCSNIQNANQRQELFDDENFNKFLEPEVSFSIWEKRKIRQFLRNTLLPLEDRCDSALKDDLTTIVKVKSEYIASYSNIQNELNADNSGGILSRIFGKQATLINIFGKTTNILSVILDLRKYGSGILMQIDSVDVAKDLVDIWIRKLPNPEVRMKFKKNLKSKKQNKTIRKIMYPFRFVGTLIKSTLGRTDVQIIPRTRPT